MRGGGGWFCYSGAGRPKGKAVRDGASERNNPAEISSPALAGRGRAEGFGRIRRVVQHEQSRPADAAEKVLQVCQKLL